jgi:hypothetical protein
MDETRRRWIRIGIGVVLGFSAFTAYITFTPGILDWKIGGRRPCSGPTCPEAHLKLELAGDRVKSNDSFGLWYRITLRNQSRETWSFESDEFRKPPQLALAWNHSQRSGLYLRVWGPDGREIVPGYGALTNPYEPLIPYRMAPEGPGNEKGYAHLRPGEEIITTPSVLAPYCPVITSVGCLMFDPAEAQKISAQVESIMKSRQRRGVAPIPPPARPGYRVLSTAYALKKPGRYRMQAVWNGPVYASPARRIHGGAAGLLAWPLQFMENLFVVKLLSREQGDARVIAAESELVGFEVTP